MVKTEKWLGKNQREVLGKIMIKPCSKHELIDITGLSNSVVSNALRLMEERGIIEKNGAHYVICRQ